MQLLNENMKIKSFKQQFILTLLSLPFSDPWFALFMCFVFPGLVCMLWGDNFWNGYWVAGGLRYIMVLHFTWYDQLNLNRVKLTALNYSYCYYLLPNVLLSS